MVHGREHGYVVVLCYILSRTGLSDIARTLVNCQVLNKEPQSRQTRDICKCKSVSCKICELSETDCHTLTG